ncbi:MAG: hypothetical protein Q9P01_02805 [Anaerolineae bacterium]|nr:hypothetical protein [Anaerolineae bacterium]
MNRFGQIGIALGALGIMVTLMGLFPTITGVEETVGIGIVQIFLLLVGNGMLIFGAILYAKFTFYLNIPSTLVQQVGIRLALTGLLFAALSGLSDILGFGSHLRSDTADVYLGWLQMVGLLANFAVSSFGVILYAVAGLNRIPDTPSATDDVDGSDKAQDDKQG